MEKWDERVYFIHYPPRQAPWQEGVVSLVFIVGIMNNPLAPSSQTQPGCLFKPNAFRPLNSFFVMNFWTTVCETYWAWKMYLKSSSKQLKIFKGMPSRGKKGKVLQQSSAQVASWTILVGSYNFSARNNNICCVFKKFPLFFFLSRTAPHRAPSSWVKKHTCY